VVGEGVGHRRAGGQLAGQDELHRQFS
jgi:hypothetical protein